MTVKVECDCRQHYAFDAEPANGRLGTTVACPACGADGTHAANKFIARSSTPIPISIPPKPQPAARLHISSHEPSAPAAPASVTVHSTLLGMVSPEQARKEAAAKIS